jgi:tetratricopeptide (TPR) repeat protein
MTEDLGGGYLSGLPADQRDELARVNAPGLAALREYLASGEAVAFLGAGASAPLYPLWSELIGELVRSAADRLTDHEATTCRRLARESPEEVVEIVRQLLGPAGYWEVLRKILQVRIDPESGRSWTPVQELVCRCPVKAVVTTNYDPGILNARMWVRLGTSATEFFTWQDELGLDRWRNGEAFGDAQLPVLFAHGQHNKPESVVLATTEYRRAYAGKLGHVLGQMMDSRHLLWIGFSFADQRIAAILREIAVKSGTWSDPGGALRHIAIMPWDPVAEANNPRILARRAEIAYGAAVVQYPAPHADHSALQRLLAGLTDDRFPPAAAALPKVEAAIADRSSTTLSAPDIPVIWIHDPAPVGYFTGRVEELAWLDQWTADPQVAVIGVTGQGGTGKTALVTHWVQEAGGIARRPGIRGVFGWSFYADPSADHWADALLAWVQKTFGTRVSGISKPAEAVLSLLRVMPLLLVLDGLEVVQASPGGEGFGRLLDGTMREVLCGICQLRPAGVVVLTSRFPFADLETFDGDSARMLDMPPLTPAEGSVLLADAGGAWLADADRRALVRAVDGHALATRVLAGLLADHPSTSNLAALRAELADAGDTNARVGKVLERYADLLAEPDRYLLAALSLFARPVDARAVLAVAGHEAFGGRLTGWAPEQVEEAVRDRLDGLAFWHPDGTISAHPLVRDTFRSLVMDATGAATGISLTGLPAGKVTTKAEALRAVEAIEVLLDAGEWRAADDMYRSRADNGSVWRTLPAARLGQRAATAFVATTERRTACAAQLSPRRLGFYLNSVGLYAMNAGDLTTAREYLHLGVGHDRSAGDMQNLAIGLRNLAECLNHLGQTGQARDAATESLACAQKADAPGEVRVSRVHLAWVAGSAGDAAAAERQFIEADQANVASDPDGDHLYSLAGIWWAEWLARTGRPGPARVLTERNAEISQGYRWTVDTARCDLLLGILTLAEGGTAVAGEHLDAAATAFRDGDYLTELAMTMVNLARHALAAGDLKAAEHCATEAITIAAPRGLVPTQSAALAVRARIRASQALGTANRDQLFQGRDAADAALRLATRHHLAWQELDALRAHATLDRAEGTESGWAGRAGDLHTRLVPADLDPDPLATVARLVAEQKAAEAEEKEGDH